MPPKETEFTRNSQGKLISKSLHHKYYKLILLQVHLLVETGTFMLNSYMLQGSHLVAQSVSPRKKV